MWVAARTRSASDSGGADYLDLAFRAGWTSDFHIVERPGLWMGERALAASIADSRAVAATSLPALLDNDIFGDDPAALGRTIVTLVRNCVTGRPIAFNALPLILAMLGNEEADVFHPELVMVDPGHRGGKLS